MRQSSLPGIPTAGDSVACASPLRRLLGDESTPAVRPVLLVGRPRCRRPVRVLRVLRHLGARGARRAAGSRSGSRTRSRRSPRSRAGSPAGASRTGPAGGRRPRRRGRPGRCSPRCCSSRTSPAPAAFGVLVAMGFLQPFRGTAQRALVADLTDAGRSRARVRRVPRRDSTSARRSARCSPRRS